MHFAEALPANSENGFNNNNFYTNGEKRFLDSYLEDGKVIFDVGANVGDWSLIASKIAPHSPIYAFEPHPKIFEVLQKKVQNRHVQCFPFAISNEEKEVTLFVWGDGRDIEKSGLNGLYYRPVLKKLLKKNCFEIPVEAITISQFCKTHNISRIHLLKIDTEGSEADVIVGAREMLEKKAIDMVQFEYGGTYKDSKVQLVDLFHEFTSLGYEIFRITPKKLKRIEAWDDCLENYQYSNYVAKLPK